MQAAARALSPAFSVVPFDFESAPKIERKQEPLKKKEKATKTVGQPAAGENAAAAANPQGNAGGAPKEKKEKKEKEKKKDAAPAEDGSKKNKGGAGGKAPAEDAGEPVPSMIDLRVGHIVDGTLSSRCLVHTDGPIFC